MLKINKRINKRVYFLSLLSTASSPTCAASDLLCACAISCRLLLRSSNSEVESSGHRQALDEKLKPSQLFVERLTILIDDLIHDSISYCACVIVRISDDFYDDRHDNRLVEIRL